MLQLFFVFCFIGKAVSGEKRGQKKQIPNNLWKGARETCPILTFLAHEIGTNLSKFGYRIKFRFQYFIENNDDDNNNYNNYNNNNNKY